LHPLRRAHELSYQQAQKLWLEIGKVLRAAVEYSGTTIRDWEIGRGRLGGYQKFLKVYGRAGELCFRCGSSIQRIKLLKRSTYFCPGCQL
ncbi:MAG: zinc finger domain-containing protein, partial [bacterium]